MRSLTLHLRILIAILVVLGISVTCYQIFVLGIPVTEDATDDLWNIDAKVEFVANPKDPVKIQMFVPPLAHDYISLNESFISNNYGVSVNRVDGNRKVTWSARRAKGNQTLYYRLVLTKRYSNEKTTVKGPTFRDSIAVEGPEKIAAEALLAPIRQHSADVETFVSETIKRVNNEKDDNVKLLLDYCIRFYDRQFITRENANHDILTRFEGFLDDYFASDAPAEKGMPSVRKRKCSRPSCVRRWMAKCWPRVATSIMTSGYR